VLSILPIALAASLVSLGPTAGGESSAAAPQAEGFEFEHPAMGTLFRIVLMGTDAEAARIAAFAAFERVDALDAALSDYRSDSELRRLERTPVGEPVRVSDDLWDVLEEAKLVASATDWAFDVTVGALTRLWRWAERRQIEPAGDRLEAARATVGRDGFELDPEARSVVICREGVQFDLGGIAKGYAVDEAFESLEAAGFASALVDGGGDLRVGKAPPGTNGWAISVPAKDQRRRDPMARVPRWTRIMVTEVAIATSGATYRSIGEDGRSHVLDPRTGLGVRGDRVVTVLASTASRADALASALTVLGSDGVEAARRLGALDATVIDYEDHSRDSGGTDGS